MEILTWIMGIIAAACFLAAMSLPSHWIINHPESRSKSW